MKKVLWGFGVASLASFALFSSTASALDISRERTLFVDTGVGAGPGQLLGRISFTALGANGQSCDYLANVTSPFNINDVALCLIHEQRTAFAPSCIKNETADFVTILQAGMSSGGWQSPSSPPQGPQGPQDPGGPQNPQNPGGPQAPQDYPCGCGEDLPPQNPTDAPQPVSEPECAGFNLKGEAFNNVALILTEGPAGLQGLQIIPGVLPTVYPVRTE